MATTTETAVVKSWLLAHERLLIVFMVLLAGGWGFSKYADLSAAKAEARASAAEQALSVQKSQNDKDASTTAQVLSQYQTMINAQTAQIASLQVIAAQRQTAVVTQQHVDATLALPELASRLKTLGGAPDGSVLSNGNYVQFTQLGAVAVTQTLETIPMLNANLADAKVLLGTAQAAQAQAQLVIAEQTKQVTGLKLTITDEEKACTTQIAAVKAEGRKNSIKWFRRGVLVGIFGGLFAGHYGL